MRAFVLGLAACVWLAPTVAHGKSWIWQSDEAEVRAGGRVRFSTRASLWISTFDRPPRACDPNRIFGGEDFPAVQRALRVSQIDFGFCPNERSDELGVGTGVEVAFRVAGPLYLTGGLDFVYTTPDAEILRNQVIVAVPIGVLFTWYGWVVRPIAHATLTPVLYITDDSRDFTLGLGGGAAYRLLDFGDLSLTVGYQSAATTETWAIQLGLHPVL